jgi:hypothetical protein
VEDEYTGTAKLAAANVIPLRSQPSDPLREPKNLPDKLLFFDRIEPVITANDFVENLLTSGGMSVIYGETTSGKTFFATDLALHVACGWPWNGRETTRGAVLYCALEGSHGISNRLAAFKYHHGIASLPFAVLPVAVDMLNASGDVDGVLDAIKKIKEVTGLDVVLTVMDTLSRALVGGNENSPDDMGAIVKNSTRIQQEGNTHVAWVHHTGKDQAKGARGHSLLRAATDTEIEVLADEGGNRTARVTKQRDLECDGEFNFTLKVVELGTNHRGKPVTSCIVDYGQETPAVARPGPKRGSGGHTKRALEILTDIIAASGAAGFAGAPPDVLSVPEGWWREQFYQRAMPAAEPETRKKAFRRAADALVESHHAGFNLGRVWLGRKSRD